MSRRLRFLALQFLLIAVASSRVAPLAVWAQEGRSADPTVSDPVRETAEAQRRSAPAKGDAQASGQEPFDERAYDLGTVVVRTTRIREARDDPSSFTTVIEPGQFASQFRSTEELLSRTPGVNIRRFGGLGQFSTVSIRGSSAEQVLVLLDGVRLNTGEGGSVDFSTVPLDMIERIEVIRGGGTTLYGSDAIGGVVNIITRKPSETPEGSATVSYGSLDTLKASVAGSGTTGPVSFLASVTHFQSEGDFGFESPEVLIDGKVLEPKREETRVNNDFFSDNVLAKLDWALTPNLVLTLNNDFFYTDRGQPGTVWDPRTEARQEVLRNLTQLRLARRDLFLESLDAAIVVFNRYDDTHFTDPVPALGNLPIDTISRNYAFGMQVEASLYRSVWKTDHGVDFRGEVRRDMLRDEVRSGEGGYDDPDRTNWEWQLQDEILLGDGRISLIPAVHFEDSSDFGTHWTGKIGCIGKPTSWLHVKANYENSFRKPNFSELYFPDQGWIRGNPDLEPEKGRNLDAGLGVSFPKLFFEAAYFRNWIEESILWLPVSFWTIMPVNTGPIDAWGVETDVEYRPWECLFLSSNYTYLHAISEATGKQADGRPRHRVNFKASLQDLLGEIYTEVQYVSSINIQSTSTGARSVNSWLSVDAGVTLNLTAVPVLDRVRFFKKWTVGFEVKNIGDASIYDGVEFPLPGRMFFGTVHAAL